MREVITLECEECRSRNYTSKKNSDNDRDRLELKKHCPECMAHTVHKETK
ncbi:50S ribosomal protein L33 [Halarsenatibacter silvermanii]|uniref:Large ribosomal subunit protein bL33 n=1 Tax=Halarsenatibacter silvermanii TaxID=321763 RepID=A0A1G9T3N5_9FIRM|nr:50S ribosomal protein L33 [Halarsenatibacter silvermanii]SDM42364.1 LSU ribosomal protein L33P [Halarsenatibacter silvermanii]